MNLGLLRVGLLAQAAEFKDLLLYLNIIAKEKCRREESKAEEIEGNLEAFLWDLEMPRSGSLGTKDQDIVVLFVQNTPPHFV